MTDDRPNILFIMSDDHAAHAMSCYGSRTIHAKKGTVILGDPVSGDRDRSLARLGRLLSKADSCAPLILDTVLAGCQYEVYQSV